MRNHLPALDGIRGLAILMVIVFHLAEIHPSTSGWYNHLAPAGQTGVTLFFVLSGFLITRILLSAREAPRFYSNFYIRRALRILPLYYAFLLYYYFVDPLSTGRQIAPISSSWWWWVYLQNLPLSFNWPAIGPNHYWSLAVEEHFYLLWPLLVHRSSRRTLNGVCLALIAMAIALQPTLRINTFYFTLTRVDGLSMGALLAVNESWLVAHRQATLRWLLGLGLGLAGCLFLLYFRFSGAGVAWVQTWKYSATSLLYTCFVGVGAWSLPESPVSVALHWRPLRFLGMISFGLYVLHPACIGWAGHLVHFDGALPTYLFDFALAVAVASASYWFYEAPFLRLKRRFAPRTP